MNNPFGNNSQAQQGEEPPVGSLERRGIAVETLIDPNVLTPGAAKSVHFRVSKPSGYSFQEVDDFVTNIVIPSIEWYAQVLYQRDKVVHTLGAELDKAEVDIKNLKSQLQFAEYNSTIKEGIERNADDKEVAALMERLTTAEAELAALQAGGAGAVVGAALLPEETAAQIAELEAYIAQITEQYNQLVAQYETDTAELQARIEALQAIVDAAENGTPDEVAAAVAGDPAGDEETAAHIAELEAYINQITEQYNQLLELYNELASSGGAEGESAPTPAVDVDVVPKADYLAVVGENDMLRDQVAALLGKVEELEAESGLVGEEDDASGVPRLPLATEERSAEVDTSKYGQLPPGIRPDDL
jgi:hypothetical protein